MVCILTNSIAKIAYSPTHMSKPWFCETLHSPPVLSVLWFTYSHNLLVSLNFSCEPQTYYYICLLTQFREQRLLKKNQNVLVRFFNFTFSYIDDVLSLNNLPFGDFVDRIPLTWSRSRNWQWGKIKNETLRRKRWFQLSHCTLSIYI
jgi:hypothetical protein